MHLHKQLPPLVLILGPTAVGKTGLSIQLAERINGEIVSADSRLFYRGMDIGTAKPTASDRQRVPHHLVDIADPDEIWSLGRFKREANKIIAGIHNRGKIPLLVGGTGQYIRAITEGWVVPELEADFNLRNVLKKWADEIGADGLHTRLESIDQSAAAKIAPNNIRRTIRALEVIFHTGRKFSQLREREGVPYHVIQVGLRRPREELYRLIDERVDAMIASGFENEVKRLLEMGYSSDLPSMSAIGYKQMVSYINEEISLEEAVELIKRMTRQFVRKQANWFREEDPDIRWFEMVPGVIDEVNEFIFKQITTHDF
jgi:tRNA dimethylallyltransferase